MHLCHLNLPIEYYSSAEGGAVATVIAESSRALLRSGHQVSVLTRVGSHEPFSVGDVVAVPVTGRSELTVRQRLTSRARQHLHCWDWAYYDHHVRAVSKALRRIGSPVDVVIAHNDLVAPRWLGTAVPNATRVLWLHNVVPHSRQRPEHLRSADLVVAVSRYLAAWSVEFGFEERRVVVVPNAADCEHFHPRSDWADTSGVLRVLCAGRVEPNKATDLVVRACAELRAEGLPVELTVAGGVWWYGHDEGRYWEEVRRAADVIGAGWLGRIPTEAMPAVMRSHDVLCLPSRSAEGYPLVLAEAKASGLAVVTSDRGGQVEAGGAAALLVRPETPGSVTAALRSLAADPAMLHAAKRRSLEEARSWQWQDSADTLMAALAPTRPVPLP
jgi:glycosyltransferase involved in cell wall biosynthesis